MKYCFQNIAYLPRHTSKSPFSLTSTVEIQYLSILLILLLEAIFFISSLKFPLLPFTTTSFLPFAFIFTLPLHQKPLNSRVVWLLTLILFSSLLTEFFESPIRISFFSTCAKNFLSPKIFLSRQLQRSDLVMVGMSMMKTKVNRRTMRPILVRPVTWRKFQKPDLSHQNMYNVR